MARKKSSMVMNASLEVETGGPLDSREVVDSLTDLTDAESFPYFYEGMTVYVKSEKKTYALVGDDPTVIENWQEIGTEYTAGQGIRIEGETIDTTLLDSKYVPWGDWVEWDNSVTSRSESSTDFKSNYWQFNGRVLGELQSNFNFEDFLWKITYIDGTTELVELRNPTEYTFSSSRKYLRYDLFIANTDTPYENYFSTIDSYVKQDTCWYVEDYRGIGGGVARVYCIGMYPNNITIQQHPAAIDMKPYHKRTVRELSYIAENDLEIEKRINNRVEEYVDGKTISPTGWGIAKKGFVQISNNGGEWGEATVDVSELGFTNTDDYSASLLVAGGAGGYGGVNTYIKDKTATGFVIHWARVDGGSATRVDYEYTIIGKGYGNNSSGWGLATAAKTSINTPSGTSATKTIDISGFGFVSADDYAVSCNIYSGEGDWANVAMHAGNKSATSFMLIAKPIASNVTRVDVEYAIFAKGYGTTVGGSGGTVDGSTTFDVTAIPQGPTDANEVIAVLSNKDNENVRLSYIRQQDGSVSNTVNLGLMSGLGDDSFEITTPAYVAAATEELQKQKVTGYFERTNYPITLDTAGQPYYALAKDSFKIEIENHKPYTYEFTASDVFDLTTRYNETVGKTFTTMNKDNETIWITMKGALPDNVQYVVGTTTPVVDLTNATITLTKTTFIQQIDDMLIPKSSGEVFVFDVDSDQFTEDPDNPGGKHIGMTITSPTFDEIMDNLVSGKMVFARMLSNGGNSYDFYQLSRESQQGIRGKAFDLEFPQGHIWFYDIYIKKRGLGTNTTTYFGVFYDKVVDGSGSGTSEVPTIDQVIAKGDTTTRSISFDNENGNETNSIDYNGLSLSGVATEGLRQVQYSQHGIKAIDNLAGTMTDIFSVDFDNKEVAMSDDIKGSFMTALGALSGEALNAALTPISQNVTNLQSAVGDLSTLGTTAQDSLVNAVNELKNGVDALGEPFRVKQWGATFTQTISIPSVTEDIANTSIPNFDFRIEGQEGEDFQVVGMMAYEIFDESSARINCFPVCQFTGEGQKLLRVRMMCAGTTAKVAKRISAWVLLKHR